MAFDLILTTTSAAQAALGVKQTQWYKWISEGLMVSPIPIGLRHNRYPENEIKAIIGARIAGQSDEQIRQLVAKLHADRLTSLAVEP
jgi:prophage regulatory protein